MPGGARPVWAAAVVRKMLNMDLTADACSVMVLILDPKVNNQGLTNIAPLGRVDLSDR